MPYPASFEPESFISLVSENFPDSKCKSINDIKFISQDNCAKGFFYLSNLPAISLEDIDCVYKKFGFHVKRPRGRPAKISTIDLNNLNDSIIDNLFQNANVNQPIDKLKTGDSDSVAICKIKTNDTASTHPYFLSPVLLLNS